MARLDIYTTRRVLDFLQFIFILLTVQHFTSYVIAVESHNQAFVQTDKHLTFIVADRYIGSGVPVEIKPASTLTLQDDSFYSNNISLDPPMLDFHEQPVGMPRMEKVFIQNNDPRHSLHLLSISGSTVHFHCSFFQDKIVPPGGNTSFDIVFLARQVGNVENTLFIHTSIGIRRYQVFGVGVPNPYRLRPYLGARVPINSSFTPVIQMHNPYSTRLQVLEMFSSEGDLHLELPSGEREASQELWELKPFETKEVMRASFVGRIESNHSAFIRIKTNKEDEHRSSPQLLILPLEIEVSSDPGIYSPVELLDFGILRTLDEPKHLRLNLINTGPKAVHITSVTVSPPNDAVSVDFRPFKLQPDGSRPTAVAQITFRAVKALQSKQWAGKIVIKTKNNIQRLAIPYQANVLHGSLVYNVNTTHFFSAKALWNVSRPVTFTNTFHFSIVIYNVSLPPEVSQYFTIVNFTRPVIIQPQQSLTSFVLKFHPNQTQVHFNTVLTLSTNASTFTIPIIVYNGLMKVIHHRPEKFEGQLDFGTLGVGECRSMIFTIRNDNPVDIVVARFQTNMSWASVEILGIEKGNGTTLTHKHNQSEINIDPLYIKPYHYAVFNVSIVAPEEEGAYVADIWMFTQFQDLFTPIIFRAARGSLHAIPDKFIFEKVYPGRVPYKVLQIHSTFDDYMEVTQVTFQPADNRFYFIPQNSNTVLLQPHEHSIVGKIFFDAKKDCRDDCYVGLPTLSPAGHQWLLGMVLDKDVADTDQYLYTKLQQKWEKLEHLQQSIANVTIELDTNQVRGFLFSAQAHLQWPSLIRKSKIKYPLTQIGNMSISDFIVENIGDEAVVVQVLPLSFYPNPHTILELLAARFSQDLTDYIESDDTNTFVLYDLEPVGKSSTTASYLAQHRKTVESTLGVIPHKHTLAAILQPGTKIKVKVGFQPKDDLARSSLIIIRNNLTIIDAVVVQGQGRKGEMRFNNKKPGSHSALTFELTEKHLKNCDTSEKKNKNVMPNFTVRRPFTLRNTGELPFYIHGFSINELPCEGYGFKVFDCSGFEMPPNSSRKINIAFTPDFTMSQIQRMLTIHTSLGSPANEANYSLQAMVPYDLLSQCSAALPRPNWEPLLYYFVVVMMGFFICCIIVLAYFESDRVMAEYIRKKIKVTNGTPTYEKSKVFDLKNITGLPVSPTQNSSNTSNSSIVKAAQTIPNGNYGGSRNILNSYTDTDKDRGHLNNLQDHVNHILNSSSSVKANSSNSSRQTKLSFLGSLKHIFTYFYNFSSSSRKSTSLQDKPLMRDSGTSPPSPVQKPTATVSALRQEPVAPVTSSNNQEHLVLSEKANPNNSSNYNNRSRKGRLNNRRQIVVDASGDTNDQGFKKLKDSKEPTSSLETTSIKRNSNSIIDDFDEWPVKYTDEMDNIEELDFKPELTNSKIANKRLTKSQKSKSRADHNKENILLHRENALADDGDDVSSTTTESSGGDVEDKHSLGPDNTSEVTTAPVGSNGSAGRRWKKGGNKQTERLVVVTNGGEMIDDDSNFEVTSKSKAHRKIRVNKETFGGDVMIPSTLELPYSLPKEKERAESNSNKRSKKPKKNAKEKGSSSPNLYPVDGADGSSDTGRESPLPIWNESYLTEHDLVPGDLTELSLQTESFVHKHSRNFASAPSNSLIPGSLMSSAAQSNSLSSSSSTGPFSAERLSTGNRSGSYSSIVSNSNSPSIPEPLGRNAVGMGGRIGNLVQSSDNSMFASPSFNLFTENGLAGIMPGNLVSNKNSHGVWTSGPAPGNYSDTNGVYGLHPIPETNNLPGFAPPAVRGLDGYRYGTNDPAALYVHPMYQGGIHDNLNQPQMTMMQQLQAERRRRLWEHHQKLSKGEDWPGFSTPPAVRTESFWDDFNTSPVEPNSWSQVDTNAPANGFWSTLTTSGWSSLQSLATIWGSTPEHSGSGYNTTPSSLSSTPAVQQLTTNSPPFNPFTSMADIWGPSSQSSTLNSAGGIQGSTSQPQWTPLGPSVSPAPTTPPVHKDE
ncbi:transmembrane protein 131 [Biomphalaria pfeifferi]|uniref:Transmembrane protein 131 n=1 Tax=Biomphalaria pfeifferi TaxID=112525 RepID=A0AAD8C3G0_BIOPF|nr:transmembrane protein 131 [Biomphalaria pfeifferi]